MKIRFKEASQMQKNVNERSRKKLTLSKREELCIVFRGESLMTAGGRNFIRGEVRRKEAGSPVESCDH